MKASDAIRAARALKKLKQHELASLIGVSQQMVSEWETDREPIAVKNWAALKDVLEVDCAVLEMPITNKTTTASTGGRAASNNMVFGPATITMDESGITCTGLDERHPPANVGSDEWAELLYWLKRYPTIINPHLFRHAFGCHMTAAGVSLRALQEMMGHSSSAITERYSQVMAETLIREMGKF